MTRARILAIIAAVIAVAIVYAVPTIHGFAAIGTPPKSSSASAVDLQKGLVAHWGLDGNGLDKSPRSNNLTLANTTTTTDRKTRANSATLFNGSTSSATANGFNVSVITKSLWVKLTSPAGNWTTIYDLGSPVSSIYIEANPLCGVNGGVMFGARVTGGGNAMAGWSNEDYKCFSQAGQWHHIVQTVTSTTMKIYVDGVLLADHSGSYLLSAANQQVNIGAGRHPFDGSIDDVRTYDRTLNAAEVSALYESYNSVAQLASGSNSSIADWDLNGDINDKSPYGRDFTNFGATTTSDRTGMAQRALSFDGAGQYASASGFSELGVSNQAFSFSGWFNSQSSSGTIIHVSQHSNGTGWCLPPVVIDNGKLVGQSLAPGLRQATGTTTITLNTWHHFAMSWSSSTNLKIYLDGVLEATTTQATYSASSAANYVHLGRGSTGCLGQQGYFNGSIDDVRVYNRVLSDPDIAEQSKAFDSQISISNLQKNLVGYWPMNGNSKDATAYGRDLTVAGSTSSSVDRKAVVAGAVTLTGSPNYLYTSQFASLSPGNDSFSIAFWVKTSANADIVNTTDGNASNFSNGLAIVIADWCGGPGRVIFNMANGGVRDTSACSNMRIEDGTWHHVVAVADRLTGTKSIYIDGTLNNSITTAFAGAVTNTKYVVGHATWTAYLSGQLDDFRQYNRALSASEVTQLFAGYR